MTVERLLGDDPVPENMVIITDGEDRPLLERADILNAVMEETLVFGTVAVRGVGRCVRWDIAGSDAHGLQLEELRSASDFRESFEALLRAAESKADALDRILRRGREGRAAGETDEYCTLQPDELSGLREVLRLRPTAGRDGAIEVKCDRVQVACNALRAIREATLGCSWSMLARTAQGKALLVRWGVKVNPVLADITPPQLQLEILGIEESGEAELRWNQSKDWISRVIQWRSDPEEEWRDLYSPSADESSIPLEGDWSSCEYSLLVHVDHSTLRSAVQSAADLLEGARDAAPFWAPEQLRCEREEEGGLALHWAPPNFPGAGVTRISFERASLESNEWEACGEAQASSGRATGIDIDSSSGCRVRARFLRWKKESAWSEVVSVEPEIVPPPPVEESQPTEAPPEPPPAAPSARARLEDESQFDRAGKAVREGVEGGKLLITWKCPPHAREDGWSAELEVLRPSKPKPAAAGEPEAPMEVEADLARDGDNGGWLPLATVPASREKHLVELEGGAPIGSYRVRFTNPAGATSAWAAAPLVGPGCLSRLTGSGFLSNLLKLLLVCLALYLLIEACGAGAGACRSIWDERSTRFPWLEWNEESDSIEVFELNDESGSNEVFESNEGVATIERLDLFDRADSDGGASEPTPTEDDRLDAAGVVSGEVSVTLTWDLRCDLDLFVTNPSGEVIHFNRRRGSCGGTLDVDQNVNASRVEGAPVEQVSWPGWPPEGEYTVDVVLYQRHGFDECQGEIPFKVRLRRPGMEDVYRQGRFGKRDGRKVRREALRFSVSSDMRQGAVPGAVRRAASQPLAPTQASVPGEFAAVANRVADDLATLGALLIGDEQLEALPRLEDHDSRLALLTSTVESLIQQEEVFEIPRDRLVPVKDALSRAAAEAARQRGRPLESAATAADEQQIGAALETVALAALERLQTSFASFQEALAQLPDARGSLGQVLSEPRLLLVLSLIGEGDSEGFGFLDSIPREDGSEAELLDVWSSAVEQGVPEPLVDREPEASELENGEEKSDQLPPESTESKEAGQSTSDGQQLEESSADQDEPERPGPPTKGLADDAADQAAGSPDPDPLVESDDLAAARGQAPDASAPPTAPAESPLGTDSSGVAPSILPEGVQPSGSSSPVEESDSLAAQGPSGPEPDDVPAGEGVQGKPGREGQAARTPTVPGSVWTPRPVEAVGLEVLSNGVPKEQIEDSVPSRQRPSGDVLRWRSELDWLVPGLEQAGDRRLMLGPVVSFELSTAKGEGAELLERTAVDKLSVAFSQGGWKVHSVSAGGARGQANFALYLEALPKGTNSAIPIGSVPDIACTSVVSREATRLSVFGGRSAWWFALAPSEDAAASEPESSEDAEAEIRWSVQSSTPTRLAAWVVVGRDGESFLELDPKPGCGPIEVEAWSGETLLARSRPIEVEVEL